MLANLSIKTPPQNMFKFCDVLTYVNAKPKIQGIEIKSCTQIFFLIGHIFQKGKKDKGSY